MPIYFVIGQVGSGKSKWVKTMCLPAVYCPNVKRIVLMISKRHHQTIYNDNNNNGTVDGFPACMTEIHVDPSLADISRILEILTKDTMLIIDDIDVGTRMNEKDELKRVCERHLVRLCMSTEPKVLPKTAADPNIHIFITASGRDELPWSFRNLEHGEFPCRSFHVTHSGVEYRIPQ